jgi:hypothetical protein
MTTLVIILLIVAGIVTLVGGIVTFIALRKARDGFEDDKGFHPTDRPRR